MSLTLSPATPRDAAPLARILGDWLRGTGWIPVLHNRGEDLGFLRRMIASHRVLVARDPDPMGFIAVKQGDIAGFCVAEQQRSRGIGKALLDAVKEGEPRLALWTFQANTRAIAFYAREGFAEVERTDGAGNEERLPDVRMIWRRAP
ncbi:MAG: GNAT family N-acetyltransferase [Rhodobacter sp.]|nr:GNAT family N-acetyltransferase [Rhodobacter sp.]